MTEEPTVASATVNEIYEYLLQHERLTIECEDKIEADRLVTNLANYKSRTLKLLRELGGTEADYDRTLNSIYEIKQNDSNAPVLLKLSLMPRREFKKKFKIIKVGE